MADLRAGFRLGDWLVEPATGQISGPRGVRLLTPPQMAVLRLLAERPGEAVDAQALCAGAWPGTEPNEELLRETVRALRRNLGDAPRYPRHLVSIGERRFALMAPVRPRAEAAQPPPLPRATGDVAPPGASFSLLTVLRDRREIRAAGAYLVVAWLVLQVAETTFEPLHLPEWWLAAVTVLAVLGLPIVLVLAWAYEIRESGGEAQAGSGARLVLATARHGVAPWAVGAVVMVAGLTGFAWLRSIQATTPVAPAATLPAAASIAVLPFVDMSTDGSGAYLGDGLSEELSAQLAQISGLRVAARTSAFAYKGKDVDVREIGRALGVRHVLEGSIRRDGGDLRVTVQLIDAMNGYHTWAETYDRDWNELLAVQDDIARAVIRALRVVLTPEQEKARKNREPVTSDPRAYDIYLAGISRLRQAGSISDIEEAQRLLGRALELDPAFGRAHAGLCDAGIRMHERTRSAEVMRQAEASCLQALESDPGIRETELALANLYMATGRSVRAETLLRGLLGREPRNADLHIALGRSLEAQQKLAQSEASLREAVGVEPGFWGAHNALGTFLFQHGRSRDAIAAFRTVTELRPGNPTGFNNLGAAQLMSGDLEGAAQSFLRSSEIEPSRSAYTNLGSVHYFRHDYARAVENYSRALDLAAEDHQVVGSLADALWLIAESRERAIESYRRAIMLAERDLEINPENPVSWAQLGYYYGRVGELERSRRYFARALEDGADLSFVNYYVALGAADRGETAATRRYASQALKTGYPAALLNADPALQAAGAGTGNWPQPAADGGRE
jgi:TolB-like protein/Flp pilus assembly protein TadD/DNA-binding winged helix-turn-helix (wHTH) protein